MILLIIFWDLEMLIEYQCLKIAFKSLKTHNFHLPDLQIK